MTVNADVTKALNGVPAIEEATPLLGAPDASRAKVTSNAKYNGTVVSPETDEAQNHSEPHEDDEDKPMPYKQIVLICFASIIEPVSCFAIFPLIGDMLVQIGGLGVEDIPLWSGLIEALFSIVQMTVMITYGKLADRVGRKPVLVFSLFGIAGATALFGLSQSLWQMILLRAFTGLFAGSSVTVRAMLSEMTTKKTQARAFSWFMFAKNLGIFVGPLIGGSLVDPRAHIPIFRHSAFFKQFPYSLSMFATAALCAIAAILALTSVKETLQTKSKGSEAAVEPPMTIRQLLSFPGVAVVVYIYGHVAFLALTYTAVSPVYSYEPIEKGGLGFSPVTISIFLAIAGASQAAWMLGPFPPLQQRYGTGAVLRLCLGVWPFMLLSFPLLNEVRRLGWNIPFWIVMSILTVMGSGVSMAFTCTQLCVNDVAPTPSTLGALNAIVLTVGCAIRAVAPILGTAIYGLGIKLMWVHGHLAWIFLVSVAVALNVGVRYLPAQAEGSPKKKVVEEEEES